MVVKIRLARFGRRKAPFYNIVVAQARTARNSKPIEVLGTYDPIPKPPTDGEGKPFKDIKLDAARAKYWIGVGAQPSDPAWRLLSMAGLLVPKYRPSGTATPTPTPTPTAAASIVPEANKEVNAVV
ncbi:Ribosomal protein S16, mitochondrial [Lachnellula willkommii]|uniref:Ribosomal protein S16, mitochondrial n=1 Tax=Lachnellula willkommii TaxID=215461 RepID=A0A559MN43_9HELO|nr:Ribosomal protein S16, mitochondrial [Lachnellula willkommii]